MQLVVAEVAASLDTARVRSDGHNAVLDAPCDGLSVAADPLGRVVGVQSQQDEGVGGRRHGPVHIGRRDDPGLRLPKFGHVVGHRRGIRIFLSGLRERGRRNGDAQGDAKRVLSVHGLVV